MSRRGAKIAAIYMAVVVVAAVPVLLKAGSLAGVYVVAATLPWSSVFFWGLRVLDRSFFDLWYAGPVVIALSALINCAILYGVTSWIERSQGRPTPPANG